MLSQGACKGLLGLALEADLIMLHMHMAVRWLTLAPHLQDQSLS